MNGYIQPPPRIPFLLKIGILLSEKITGKKMLPARLLAWSPKTAIGSGILESLVVHKDQTLSERMLKLVRMQTSFFVSCPFCIDMNSLDYQELNITDDEIIALQGKSSMNGVDSFTEREIVAMEYVKLISQTPLSFSHDFIEKLKGLFTEREIVVLAATVAQVNYWARLIQALGIPPAGFSSECSILEVEQYQTLKE
jgi:alkylhydroperoxidase family enzyme